MDKRSNDKEEKEQDVTTPGPTSGGMGSMGAQHSEPTLEEKLGVDAQPQDEAPGQHTDDPRLNKGAARQGPPPAPPRKVEVAKPEAQEPNDRDSRPPANSPETATKRPRIGQTRK